MATSSLQQAQVARDDKQAEVDNCNAALDTAKGNVLLAYTLALNKTQDDLDAFCLRVLQTYPAAQNSQVNAEQVYINAYVALQEVQDELQAAQTLVAQLSSNAGATNADVIQKLELLFQFVDTKFGEMEARIAAVDARVAAVEIKANSAKGITVEEVKSACKAGVKELKFRYGGDYLNSTQKRYSNQLLQQYATAGVHPGGQYSPL